MTSFLRCTTLLALALAPVTAAAQDPVEIQQVGLMPLELSGAEGTELQTQLQDALRQGLLEGAVEINLFNERGVCRTAPCRDALAGVDVVVIRPKVDAAGGDYSILIDVLRPGEPEPIASFENACGGCDAEGVANVLTELSSVLLDAIGDLPEPREESASSPDAPAITPTTKDRGRKPIRPVWGALSLGAGVALVGAGAVMLGLDGREHKRTCADAQLDVNGACPNVWTTQGPGIGLLVGGAALIGTGIGLLVKAKKDAGDRESRPTARVGVGPGSVVLSGRF